MTARTSTVACLWLTTWLGGCTQGLSGNASQTRVFQAALPDDVFNAAIVILQREFGRLTINREGRTILSEPMEFRTAANTGSARGLVGARTSMRQQARFSVGRRGAGAIARLRIDVERKDTQQQRIRQYQGSRLSDAPGGNTPIERDAATTRRQNTVWTRVRRDRTMERALLNELHEALAPRAAPAEQTSGTTPAKP